MILYNCTLRKIPHMPLITSRPYGHFNYLTDFHKAFFPKNTRIQKPVISAMILMVLISSFRVALSLSKDWIRPSYSVTSCWENQPWSIFNDHTYVKQTCTPYEGGGREDLCMYAFSNKSSYNGGDTWVSREPDMECLCMSASTKHAPFHTWRVSTVQTYISDSGPWSPCGCPCHWECHVVLCASAPLGNP